MSATRKTIDFGGEGGSAWYTHYTEPLLTSELHRLSLAASHSDTDSLSFQPCLNRVSANQDRYAVHDWSLPDGLWSFRAIFDGHSGHATVNHAVRTIPDLIKSRLELAPSHEPHAISTLLADTIVSFDDSIAQDFLRFIPDPQTVAQMSDEQLHTLVHDLGASPEKSTAAKRCMHGTTLLIALLDPSRSNLWVASLGDCQAALGRKDKSGKWTASLLSSFHNGRDQAEVERIRREHPGETECVHEDRVLGAIAVTRALGDFAFKFPADLTGRILARIKPGFKFSVTTLSAVLTRTHTPPYLSNRPDIQHVNLTDRDQYQDIYLIMCSDGLLDLYLDLDTSLTLHQLPQVWLDAIDNRDTSLESYNNLSLALLRHAIGGNDVERVSRAMSYELKSRWMDDTTILVQRI